MRGHSGVCVSPKVAAQEHWLEPIRDGMNKHRRFVWLKRGGNSKTSGSGPSGCKSTPRALLARSLRDRPGVAQVVTARQAARVARKASPPAVIWGRPLYQCWRNLDTEVSRIIGPEGFEAIVMADGAEAIARCQQLNRESYGKA